MSADVVDIAAYRPDPHYQGPARCASCGHTWRAVARVGTVWLTCPACGTEHGLLVHPVTPIDPECWTCRCGSQVFHIGRETVTCVVCGLEPCCLRVVHSPL